VIQWVISILFALDNENKDNFLGVCLRNEAIININGIVILISIIVAVYYSWLYLISFSFSCFD